MCLYTHYNTMLIKTDKTVGYKYLDYDKCLYISLNCFLLLQIFRFVSSTDMS